MRNRIGRYDLLSSFINCVSQANPGIFESMLCVCVRGPMRHSVGECEKGCLYAYRCLCSEVGARVLPIPKCE